MVSSSGKVRGYSEDPSGASPVRSLNTEGRSKTVLDALWFQQPGAVAACPRRRRTLPTNRDGRVPQLLESPFVNSHLLNESVCQSEVQNLKYFRDFNPQM